MKHAISKAICTVLCISAVLSVLFACGENTVVPGSDSTSVTSGVSSESVSEEVTTARIEPNIPNIKYDGEEVTFLTWVYEETGSFFNDITSHGYDGTLINDATYNRNLTIQEKYGVEIKTIEQDRYSAGNFVKRFFRQILFQPRFYRRCRYTTRRI